MPKLTCFYVTEASVGGTPLPPKKTEELSAYLQYSTVREALSKASSSSPGKPLSVGINDKEITIRSAKTPVQTIKRDVTNTSMEIVFKAADDALKTTPSPKPTPLLSSSAGASATPLDVPNNPNAPKGISRTGNACWAISLYQMMASSPSLTEGLGKIAPELANPATINSSLQLAPLTNLYPGTEQQDPSLALTELVGQQDAYPFRATVETKTTYDYKQKGMSEKEVVAIQSQNELDDRNVRTKVTPEAYSPLYMGEVRCSGPPSYTEKPVVFQEMLKSSFKYDTGTKAFLEDLNGSKTKIPANTTDSRCYVTPPQHLLFRIGRTDHDKTLMKPLKKDSRDVVGIFEPLDMKEYIINGESSQYELQSFNVHQGSQLNEGHYIAYVKKGDQWYKCNDGIIDLITEKAAEEASKQAFLVHFEKVESEASKQDRVANLAKFTAKHTKLTENINSLGLGNITNLITAKIKALTNDQCKTFLSELKLSSTIPIEKLRIFVALQLLKTCFDLQADPHNTEDFTKIIEELTTFLKDQFKTKPDVSTAKEYFNLLFSEKEQTRIFEDYGANPSTVDWILSSLFSAYSPFGKGKYAFDNSSELYHQAILKRLETFTTASRKERLQYLEIQKAKADDEGNSFTLEKEYLELKNMIDTTHRTAHAKIYLDYVLEKTTPTKENGKFKFEEAADAADKKSNQEDKLMPLYVAAAAKELIKQKHDGKTPLSKEAKEALFVAAKSAASYAPRLESQNNIENKALDAVKLARQEMIISRYKVLIDDEINQSSTIEDFEARKAKLQPMLTDLINLAKQEPYKNLLDKSKPSLTSTVYDIQEVLNKHLNDKKPFTIKLRTIAERKHKFKFQSDAETALAKKTKGEPLTAADNLAIYTRAGAIALMDLNRFNEAAVLSPVHKTTIFTAATEAATAAGIISPTETQKDSIATAALDAVKFARQEMVISYCKKYIDDKMQGVTAENFEIKKGEIVARLQTDGLPSGNILNNSIFIGKLGTAKVGTLLLVALTNYIDTLKPKTTPATP